MLELQNKIKYKFKNIDLLKEAMTHSSFARENNTKDNERMEFLGDGILGAIIGAYLFCNYKDYDEGLLSESKAYVVNKKKLSDIARKYEIGTYLFLGKGEEYTKGRQKDSNLSNALEAIIGAVFLDSDYNTTKDFVLSLFEDELLKKFISDNYKGKLQEICVKKYTEKPKYKLVSAKGAAHKKIFISQVILKDEIIGTGRGKSKRESQQMAAYEALKNSFCID